MRVEWISLLRDPIDKSKLKLIDPVFKNGRLLSGKLLSSSGRVYRIKEGIPILLSRETQSLNSVKSFAFEWDEWGYLFAKKNWLKNNIDPLLGNASKFKNKIIIDAGAGSGAQSRWMAEAGARMVISLELSDTIFSRHKKTIKGFESVIFPIQCDISYLPIVLKPDILYCVNVLQHTKDPKKTFRNLISLMNKKTLFMFNVYNEEGFLGSYTVKILRQIIKLLPFRIWRGLAYIIASGILLLDKTVPWIIKLGYGNVHFSKDLKELWLQIYDAFGSHHYQYTLSQKEQINLFKEAKLKVKARSNFGYLLVKA